MSIMCARLWVCRDGEPLLVFTKIKLTRTVEDKEVWSMGAKKAGVIFMGQESITIESSGLRFCGLGI